MASRNRQEGLAAATVVIVIILAVMALALGRGAFQREAEVLDQRSATHARLRKIQDALVAYAMLNGRLPCPAGGNPGTGDASPDAPTTACTEPDGVVPWRTLALRREDALDGWNRQISYRVFGGATGFTQAGGVNMTNCNSSLGFQLDDALDPGALCKPGAPPPNTPRQFLATRGDMLVVNEMGSTIKGNAFVLVSHGETGYGAFPANGASGRLALPNNAGGEYANVQPGATYSILPRSDPAIPASDAGHFDDVVAYMSATDLATRAKLAARSWAELNIPLSAEFSLPNVSAAAPGLSGENTGQAYLTMGGFVVLGIDSSFAIRNIGIRTEDGITGLGVVGGGSTAGDLNSALGERLLFLLGGGSEFHKMDIAFNRFRVVQLAPTRLEERAEVSFLRDGDVLQTSVVTSWVEPVQPARCLFSLLSPAVFDRVDVRPISRTGDGGQTTFTVAEVKACTEATASCATTVTNALDCPARPPSASSTVAQGVTATSATLKGFASDNGASTTVSFDYGTTCAYPSNTAASPGSLSAGAGKTSVSATVAGLACNTSYYFRTNAASTGGITTGNGAMFTTAACASPMPIATTVGWGKFDVVNPGPPPTYKTMLSAIVDANGADTTVTFDYGSSNCYGSSLPSSPLPGIVAAGAGATNVFAELGNPSHPDTPTPELTCSTRYHFRVRSVSAAGTTTGDDVAFTTPPCP